MIIKRWGYVPVQNGKPVHLAVSQVIYKYVKTAFDYRPYAVRQYH
jgi:hypothetical protein